VINRIWIWIYHFSHAPGGWATFNEFKVYTRMPAFSCFSLIYIWAALAEICTLWVLRLGLGETSWGVAAVKVLYKPDVIPNTEPTVSRAAKANDKFLTKKWISTSVVCCISRHNSEVHLHFFSPKLHTLLVLRHYLPDQCWDDLEVLQSPHRTPCTSRTQDTPAETQSTKYIHFTEIFSSADTLVNHCNLFCFNMENVDLLMFMCWLYSVQS